jgi:hypothetical protein
MYDEATDSRLPAYDIDGRALLYDRIPIAVLSIEGVQESEEVGHRDTGPKYNVDYQIYLPFIQRWRGNDAENK